MANLLTLNVDHIFEQNNVSEIESINRKIQAEIENKREELRMMVGERYRDLIQAADTIAEMKITSANISANITNLNIQNQEHSIGFKTETEQQRKQNRSVNANLYGVVVQIKILTILPELIWSRIDVDDFFVATQLFIFSRHISTGLKLDVNNNIMKRFPVAKKQWDLLAPFFYTIKQQCLQTLERENLTSDVASKCLASLLLLENCQLDKLLTTFVQTRLKTFTAIIESDSYGVVKEKLLKSMKVLISTVSIIHDCFIGANDKDGLLIQELEKISSENSKPTLTLLNNERSLIFETLPDIIAKYKPQVFFNQLNKESMKTNVQSWLKSVENISQVQLKSLIQMIVSIKTIQDIQQQIRETVKKPENWDVMCKDLGLPNNIDFFKEFYQSLINDRIQNIINIFWTTVLAELNVEVEKLISENDRVHRDMKHYVWTEDILDNPLSLKDALSNNKQSHRLLMKVKGFTMSIVELCNKIDGNLELLFNDLKMYLGGGSDVIELRRVKDVDPNHQKLILFLRECSKENISSLITSIKSSKFNKSAENCIMLSRLLQAMSELCPNLRLCFSGHLLIEPSFMRDPSKNDDGENEWNSICGLLEEESIRFWCMWMEIFVSEWKILDQNMDLNTMLKDFPCWDTITIEEKDESENVIQSQIHVPSQLSLSVQCWTYDIITSLSRIVPHTLPKSIHLRIIHKLVEKLYDRYHALSVNEFVIGNQKAAWQFFLDIKVLTMLFIGRDMKVINEKLQVLLNHFKSIIDPFDFDVFYQHVNGNIKRNVARLQYGMGCLVPNMEHLNSVLANQNTTSPHDKDPNILMMSSTATTVGWFPLLPIINVKENVATPVQEVVKKEEKRSQQQTVGLKPSGGSRKQQQQVSASSSSSALSSLQDWFR